jgi:hypothetical protein
MNPQFTVPDALSPDAVASGLFAALAPWLVMLLAIVAFVHVLRAMLRILRRMLEVEREAADPMSDFRPRMMCPCGAGDRQGAMYCHQCGAHRAKVQKDSK